MTEYKKPYPAGPSVDYPDRELNRLTTFFRLVVIIPIGILLCLVNGSAFRWGEDRGWLVIFSAGGVLFLVTMFMLVFRRSFRAGGSTGIRP